MSARDWVGDLLMGACPPLALLFLTSFVGLPPSSLCLCALALSSFDLPLFIAFGGMALSLCLITDCYFLVDVFVALNTGLVHKNTLIKDHRQSEWTSHPLDGVERGRAAH